MGVKFEKNEEAAQPMRRRYDRRDKCKREIKLSALFHVLIRGGAQQWWSNSLFNYLPG